MINIASSSGTSQQPVFGIDWGFRVALGYELVDDLWEIAGIYSWIHFKGSMETSALAGERLHDLLSAADAEVFPTEIHNHTTFHYSNLDIVLKRMYKFAHYLSIEPLFGFEAQWIRVSQKNSDSGGNLQALFGEPEYDIHVKHTQFTVGPIAGIHTLWDIGLGFSLSGNIDIALTTGVNHLHENESNSSRPINIDVISRVHHNQLHTQTFLGVVFDKTIKESVTIGAKVGWELLLLTNAILGPGITDLASQGGTFGLWLLF